MPFDIFPYFVLLLFLPCISLRYGLQWTLWYICGCCYLVWLCIRMTHNLSIIHVEDGCSHKMWNCDQKKHMNLCFQGFQMRRSSVLINGSYGRLIVELLQHRDKWNTPPTVSLTQVLHISDSQVNYYWLSKRWTERWVGRINTWRILSLLLIWNKMREPLG